jgi:hypothetical protein
MGGSGGTVIVGGHDLATVIEENLAKVASFRQTRCKQLLAQYWQNENSLDDAANLFLLRCAADIVDNK